MKSLSPNIFVNDMKETINFYKFLDFNISMSVPPEGEDFIWVMMNNGHVNFMFQTFDSLNNEIPEVSRNNGGSLLFYINVENIRSLFDKVKDKVTVLKMPAQTFYGATEFTIKDNNGYVLTFAQDE